MLEIKIRKYKNKLEPTPLFSSEKILFYNFDRSVPQDRISLLKQGELWLFKSMSRELPLNKTDRRGTPMFRQFVSPIRRSEVWHNYRHTCELRSGDRLLKQIETEIVPTGRYSVSFSFGSARAFPELAYQNPLTGETIETSWGLCLETTPPEIDNHPLILQLRAEEAEMREAWSKARDQKFGPVIAQTTDYWQAPSQLPKLSVSSVPAHSSFINIDEQLIGWFGDDWIIASHEAGVELRAHSPPAPEVLALYEWAVAHRWAWIMSNHWGGPITELSLASLPDIIRKFMINHDSNPYSEWLREIEPLLLHTRDPSPEKEHLLNELLMDVGPAIIKTILIDLK